MVDTAAAANGLPIGFLTRIIWHESRFRPEATSPKGAEGVAQFMPQTAAERGLTDPRDPGQAVAHAARFLVELEARFGNLGLAAAAYNAGAARVTKWLAGEGTLPAETRNYVYLVTGRVADDWFARKPLTGWFENEPCIGLTAELARESFRIPVAAAVWQARLDGTLKKAIEGLTELGRRQTGSASERAARIPIASRAKADDLCAEVRALGAKCEVYGP
jgi:hypothetical protein